MDAHFANQIGQKTIRTPNAVAFRGPARQYGSGGLGAFAMRMGRVAVPLVKQYVMPVAKDFGKNLLSSFVPEISNVISDRKRPKTVLGETLKKRLQKPLLRPPPPLLQKELMLALIHQKNQLQVYLRLCDRLRRRGGRRGQVTNDGAGRHRAGSGTSSGRGTRDNKVKEVINRKKFAARSRSDILSGVAFNN